MNLTARKTKIVEKAREMKDGWFLLPRRFKKPEPYEAKDNLDLDYDACESLVLAGLARWLRGSSAPGIILAGELDVVLAGDQDGRVRYVTSDEAMAPTLSEQTVG